MPQVVKWGSGGTPKATEKQYYDGGSIPWLVIGDLNDSIVSSSASKITELGLQNSSAKMIPAGTLLVAMYGSIGKLGITGIECCTNQAIAYAKELYGVTTKYMFFYMAMMKSELISKGKGGTQKNISQTVLNSLEVIVPPLPEQERIVARIEELFSQLDAGVETLKKTKAQLAVYRQAVVEDAIATAKHRGATVLPFGTFVLQYQNGISKRSGEGIQTPVLRLADIENQRISNDDGLRLIGLSKIERDRFVLKRGDLLIVRVNGSEKNVGRAIVVDKDDSYAACDHFIRCLVDFSHIIPEYAQLLLDSFSARKHIKENMVSSAGQNTVSQTTMSSIMVYVPDISLQEKIMVSVNERFSMCDSIEQTVDTALQQAEAMRQSILKDAFEGRL